MHFVEIIIEYLPIFMFLTMGVLLFIGYPVGFILGGVAITYGFIGYLFGVFKLAEFFNFVPIEVAKVLFLNNAVNQGVLIPLGAAESAETGQSIYFLS